MTHANSEIPFSYLRELQIDRSLLTVEEEKRRIICDDDSSFSGLRKRAVLSQPALFQLTAQLCKELSLEITTAVIGDKQYIDRKQFEKELTKILSQPLSETILVKLLQRAVNSEAICSYWDALRVIAFHSFRNRKIIDVDGELKTIRTRKQFEYYFHSRQDVEQLGNCRSKIGIQKQIKMLFDGSAEEAFELFFQYVRKRLLGQLQRQKKRGDKAPLLVWKERFKDDLTVFFKAKVGGNGYAKDYLDSKLRVLKKEGKKLSGTKEADLVREKLLTALDSDRFSHQEYLCLMAVNRGHSQEEIAAFTGFSVGMIREFLDKAVPRAAVLIFESYCEQYGLSYSEEGVQNTITLVQQILGLEK